MTGNTLQTHKANLLAMAKPTHGWQTQHTHALTHPQQINTITIQSASVHKTTQSLPKSIQAMNHPTLHILNLLPKHQSGQALQPSIPEIPGHIQPINVHNKSTQSQSSLPACTKQAKAYPNPLKP